MGYVPDWSRQDHKKTSGGKAKEGIRHGDSLFHGNQPPARAQRPKAFLADGGDATEAALKAEGLEASKGESVSLWDRLKAGNIDEAGSKANMQFGSGRGRAERQIAAAEDGIMNSSPTRNSSFEDAAAEDGIMNSSPTRNSSLGSMTAAEFQRTDKDTTPVPMPSPRRAAATSKTSNAELSDDAEMRKQQETAKRELRAGMYQPNEMAAESFRTQNEIEQIRASTAEARARKERERQAQLRASGVPSVPRIGASLMDRGRAPGNYADGGMVKKGKRKC